MTGMARRAWILGASLWLALGCECGDEQFGRVVPELEVATDAIAFGEVPLGAIKRVALAVRNAGQAPLNLLAIDAPMPFGVQPGPFEVQPGETMALELWFRPTNSEAQSGQLTLMSDDPDRPMVTVPLSGLGVQGFVSVVPGQVDFQLTKVGTTRSVELLVDNRGLESVQGTLRTLGFSQPEHYALTLLSDFAASTAFAIPARTQVVLDLEYAPLDVGEHPGRILFEICGEGCGLEVEVLASASAPLVRLAPAQLDFGDVGIDQPRTLQLRVENGGDSAVQVDRVEITGSPDLSAEVARGLPTTLAAGDALGINVQFLPTSAASVMGEVEVQTGPVLESIRASVVGRGVGPQFRVEPETLSFGVERRPDTYRRVALLVNAGSSQVQVHNLSISGDPAYQLGTIAGLPARLGPGESMSVPVLFSPVAVTEYFGTLTVESDDAERAQVQVPLSGALTDRYCDLEVSPNRVSFGLLPPTFVRNRFALVRNIGTDPCNITSAQFRLPLDPAITERTQPWPAVLQPGDERTLTFEYAPLTEAESKVTYVMHTDDPVFPDRTVSIFGTSQGNLDIFTSPPFVDFGTTGIGCAAATQDVLLINAGTVDAVVSNFTLTSSSSDFMALRPLITPLNLRAGDVTSFEVAYQPQDLGQDAGEVELAVQSYGFSINVPLQGSAAQNPRATDRFEQVLNDKVDVLFVIDDSCSMGDDQAALAANFQSFIQQADVRQVDFRLGVTTTDTLPLPGLLKGPVLNRTTPNLEAAFQAQAAVGTFGSGFEQGLEGMYGALQFADQGNTPQAELLRPDAARVVVIVSDEDDQSPLSVPTYYTELRSRSPKGVTTAMVTGGAGGCSSSNGGGSATPAPRYEQFATLTSGLSESICSNWAQTLANIGQAAFGLRTKFILSRDASQSDPILVWIDGQPVTQGWHYDAADGAIVFDSPPSEGAEVVVEFTPVC